MEIIKICEVSKSFGNNENRQQVLKNISLNIDKGEMISIMGPSGSGKSTLMNIIGLLDRISDGKYVLDSEDTSSLSDNQLAKLRNQKIGFVFQGFNLIKELSALDNVKMNLIFSNIYKKKSEKIRHKELNDLCYKALESVGLKEHANKKPGQLSGGQQQRVAIARALVNNPDIILADEPTGALDSKTGEDIMKRFLALNKLGKTIVIVTHDQKVADLCQRTIYLKDGVI